MQLWRVPAFTRGVHERQRFREHREPCLWLSHNPLCFCEERQKIWLEYHCSCGTPGCHALMYLLNPFLRLSLVRERPASYDKADCHPVWKSLFRRKAHSGFGAFLGATLLPAKLMEYRSSTQGKTQAIGVRNLLCQGHCLVAPHQPLVRIPQIPQRPGGMAAAHHTRALPIEEHRGAVLLGIIECYALGKMRVRIGYS